MKEKRCIGEKVLSFCKFFPVAIPDNDNEFIRVSFCPVAAYDATFYYDVNTAEEFRYMDFIKKFLSPEWAAAHIPGYRPEMKIALANAYCDFYVKGMFDERKANERLYDKLSSMTRWEYYNSKW